MAAEYTGIATMIAVASALAALVRAARCRAGVSPGSDATPSSAAAPSQESDGEPASAPFYLVGVLVLVVQVAVLLLVPWAALFRELGGSGFVATLVFLAVFGTGLAYAWLKGILKW